MPARHKLNLKRQTRTYHNLSRGRNFRDLSGAKLAVLDIGRPARPHTRRLRGRVDADKDDVGLGNGSVDIRGEKQISVKG